MWNRSMLKEKAKATLRKFYWQTFVVALVMLAIGGITITGPFGSSGGGGSSSNDSDNNTVISTDIGENVKSVLPDSLTPNLPSFNLTDWSSPIDVGIFFWMAIIGVTVFMFALFLIWRIFLGYPIEVGCRKFFMNAAKDEQAYNDMTRYFNNATYWNVVRTMFVRAVYNTLWYLLLIIPGIVKSYGYSMVPYILADNPNMHYEDAINLSQDMTDGHKFNMFVLDLSFIGWYFLGLIACGLGGVFVNPYYLATHAELYLVLRAAAIEKGFCRPETFNLENDLNTL